MAVQTLATLTVENKQFYERALLERLQPNLVFAKYGTKKSYSKHEGDTINFRKFNALDPESCLTPLTEGVSPEGQDISITSMTCKVQQYGGYVTLSDKIDIVGIDPVLAETSELLGEEASMVIDTITRDIVCAGTNVQYANGVSGRSAVNTVMDATEIKKAVRTLRKNKVKTYTGKHYLGIVSAEVEFDIMNDPLWKDVSTYSASTQIFDGEIGTLAGVRFVRADNLPKYAGAGSGSKDVHATIILGKDAYGVVDIAGSSKPEMIVKPVGAGDDPLNQRSTAGWKAMFTAIRLEELAIVRIETLATA